MGNITSNKCHIVLRIILLAVDANIQKLSNAKVKFKCMLR